MKFTDKNKYVIKYRRSPKTSKKKKKNVDTSRIYMTFFFLSENILLVEFTVEKACLDGIHNHPNYLLLARD